MYRGLLDGVARGGTGSGDSGVGRSLTAVLLAPLMALGFWASVALPAAYVPLFLVGVVDGAVGARLVALHAVAVLVGHPHRR